MTRRPLDFYPTPPDATRAVVDFIRAERAHLLGAAVPKWNEARRTWLDPAAGCGALLREIAPYVPRTVALEMDEARAQLAAKVADEAHAGDALATVWPPSCVIANPPFNMLDAFAEKIVAHVQEHQSYALVLVRCQWLDDGQGRHVRFKPREIWRMPWRLKFIQNASDATSHAWLLYGPEGPEHGATATSWLTRPAIGDEEWARHWLEADQIDAAQGTLFG